MTEVLPNHSFPERIKALISMYGNKEKLAKACGISAVMLGKYEAGSEPSRDKLLALAKASGVRIEWLVAGVGDMRAEERPADHIQDHSGEGWASPLTQGHRDLKPADTSRAAQFVEDFVLVPRYKVDASAGGGSVIHSEQIVDHLAFKRDWLQTVMGLSVKDVALINVKGDSMERTLSNDDLILVDLRTPEMEDHAIYVLQYAGTLLVKRIQRKLDGSVIVKGDNPMYEPEILTGDAVGLLNIIGRVVWCGRKM